MIEIHEVFPTYYGLLETLSEDNELTFDDGLYSQYLYLKNNPEVCKKSTVFVSSNIIREKYEEPIKDVVLCDMAHALAYNLIPNKSAYMSLEEILELKSLGVKIGYHGANHWYLPKGLRPSEAMKIIREEIIESTRFNEENHIFDNVFCTPYNQDRFTHFYVSLYEKRLGLEKYSMKFMENRTPIENYIQGGNLLYDRWMFKRFPKGVSGITGLFEGLM